MKTNYDIAVVHGDGIGPEVSGAALKVLAATFGSDTPLNFTEYPAGAEHFLKTGDSFPEATLEACRGADAILHGAAGIPGVVHPDGTEVGLDFILKLRFELDLFANIRPCRLFNGVTGPLANTGKGIDFIIARENTEGLYAARGAGSLLRSEVAVDTLIQTRVGSERIIHRAFELARLSNGAPADGVKRVTCCDKANVLRSYAFFRSIFDEIATEYPEIEAEHVLIDAMTMHMIRKPDHFNVVVTESMFGDILSDLGAAVIGGLGLAPSAEVGVNNGLFQASHGSAPDIAGKGLANPYGTILSAASMLDWLGERFSDERLTEGAGKIRNVCSAAIAARSIGADLGGQSTTQEITDTLCASLI